jgi:hypothetical protein
MVADCGGVEAKRYKAGEVEGEEAPWKERQLGTVAADKRIVKFARSLQRFRVWGCCWRK